MVEIGQSGEVVGDKGRFSSSATASNASSTGMGRKEGAEAMWAITLISSLWKKQIWNDSKTVSIAVRACSHPAVKVQSAGLHFFLGSEDEDPDSDGEESDEGPDLRRLAHQRVIKKKTKSDDRRLRRAHEMVSKKRKEKKEKEGLAVNFPALELLNDPQKFGEDLYENLNKHGEFIVWRK